MANSFPTLTCSDVLRFQFSSWYPKFKSVTMKSIIIHPLSADFKDYLLADSIFMPEGSEELEEDSDAVDGDERSEGPRYAFPELDAQIRRAISEFEAVFPKLNFTAPKDASWMLSSPRSKCVSPADVYLLLKSSDFAQHDLSTETVFAGCEDASKPPPYELELVLRKWYQIDPSREFRCFVRNRTLIGISQREPHTYDYMVSEEFQQKVKATTKSFWEREVKEKWPTDDYVFDFLLTRSLDSGHVVDFQPYVAKTDALLFTYDELEEIRTSSENPLPVLRVVCESTDISRITPQDLHNRVPMDFLSLSAGQTVEEFQKIWREEIHKASADTGKDSDSDE